LSFEGCHSVLVWAVVAIVVVAVLLAASESLGGNEVDIGTGRY
jgi:hypothetical protein